MRYFITGILALFVWWFVPRVSSLDIQQDTNFPSLWQSNINRLQKMLNGGNILRVSKEEKKANLSHDIVSSVKEKIGVIGFLESVRVPSYLHAFFLDRIPLSIESIEEQYLLYLLIKEYMWRIFEEEGCVLLGIIPAYAYGIFTRKPVASIAEARLGVVEGTRLDLLLPIVSHVEALDISDIKKSNVDGFIAPIESMHRVGMQIFYPYPMLRPFVYIFTSKKTMKSLSGKEQDWLLKQVRAFEQSLWSHIKQRTRRDEELYRAVGVDYKPIQSYVFWRDTVNEKVETNVLGEEKVLWDMYHRKKTQPVVA